MTVAKVHLVSREEAMANANRVLRRFAGVDFAALRDAARIRAEMVRAREWADHLKVPRRCAACGEDSPRGEWAEGLVACAFCDGHRAHKCPKCGAPKEDLYANCGEDLDGFGEE